MADNKKETERAELHRTIWGIANDLRGSVDGWDFKQYVLGMLFYRYISENLDRYISKGEIEAGNTDFSYTKLSDEEAETAKDDIVKEKGFFILPSQLFENVLENARKDNTDLNEKLAKIEENKDKLDSQKIVEIAFLSEPETKVKIVEKYIAN